MVRVTLLNVVSNSSSFLVSGVVSELPDTALQVTLTHLLIVQRQGLL